MAIIHKHENINEVQRHTDIHEPLLEEIWQRFESEELDTGEVFCIIVHLVEKFSNETHQDIMTIVQKLNAALFLVEISNHIERGMK